jgi:hypothetical protein
LLKKPLAISAFGELDAPVVSGDGGLMHEAIQKAVGVEEY